MNRQADISKSRIAENIAAAAESKKRKESRGYTKLSSKRLTAGVFERRRGPKSQEELKAAFERGEKVSHCDKCGKYFKNTHSRCKPKEAQKEGKRTRQLRKRTATTKGSRPVPAAPPSPVLSTQRWSEVESQSDIADDSMSSVAERVHIRRTRRRIDEDVGWDENIDGNSSMLSASDNDDG